MGNPGNKIASSTLACVVGLVASVQSLPQALAWGERGHHTICEVATRLVQEQELKRFLVSRGHRMGHLCNIPDIHWRKLEKQAKKEVARLEQRLESGKEAQKPLFEKLLKQAENHLYRYQVEYSTHFFQPDTFHLELAEMPLSYPALFNYVAVKYADDINLKMGSSWWRADQFFRLAQAEGKKASLTQGEKFETAVFKMIESMGLMGHFVGDTAQPFHNSGDHDGWGTGNGGIHSYYEGAAVSQLSLALPEEVYQTARGTHPKLKLDLNQQPIRWEPGSSVIVQRMKELSVKSLQELDLIRAIDDQEIILPGSGHRSIGKNKQQSSVRKKAHRIAQEDGAEKFHDLIVVQLARAAKLLALFWDEVYRASGKPELSKYKSSDYPLAPEDVPSDYALDPLLYRKF